MRSWAIGLVMAWWFAQLHLELVGSWLLGRNAAEWLALVAALVLGGLLQGALDVRRRAHTLPLLPVFVLAAAAGWLLFGPLAFGKADFFGGSLRGTLEWVMAAALMLGSGWIALNLAPTGKPVIGPGMPAPTLRLALALGVVLGLCSTVWVPPWLSAWALHDGAQLLRPQERGVVHSLGGWLLAACPFALAAALVWGARLGPRLLASRPGITRVNVYLGAWALMMAVPLLARLGDGGSARSFGSGAALGLLLVGAVFIGTVLPVVHAMLLWAVFRLLFTLGAAQGKASDAAAAPASPVGVPAVAEIKRLVGERKLDAALARYAKALQLQPSFDPGTSSVVPLAKHALKARRADLALRLLEVFGQRRPADTRMPLFRWLHGQALIGAGRVPDGLAELRALVLHDAHDPLAREARSLLARHGAA